MSSRNYQNVYSFIRVIHLPNCKSTLLTLYIFYIIDDKWCIYFCVKYMFYALHFFPSTISINRTYTYIIKNLKSTHKPFGQVFIYDIGCL